MAAAESPREGERDRTLEAGPRLDEPLPLWGVLDNVRSAFNVGSIFRTAEAARMSGLELGGITPYPPNQQIDRTALGTAHRVPHRHHVRTIDAVDALRGRGIEIWAVELDPRAVSLRSAPTPGPVALVFGHEVLGVSEEVRRRADRIVELPLYGRKNSLNVAVTFGIVVFDLLRRWGR